ncbi:PASTA domain-containing protein [Dysgonomonas alginatilytica]|uniref:PASTA domain-containing protein n=1 Tax=Dysgonomonas alginatilytica TaxID=1605892 RepID=A0A2V3PSF8_9BACT|nr:PASTA domain-containing protein [Dysgonomonas alginatilytica]PXV67535.1 PASTA domain-containing protein [Dysgonomonas alginatilytica]
MHFRTSDFRDTMGKDKQTDSFLKKAISNTYVRNIAAMVLIAIVLTGITLFFINKYTRHDQAIEVPDLKGLQIEDAAAMIAAKNLRYEIVDSLFQKDGVPGAILEQIPSGKSNVKHGRTIYLTVQARNEPLVAIPDLEDASLRQAETLLNALGIYQINIVSVPSEFQDLVYGVEYKGTPLKGGQKIPKGSTVTLKVGNGNGSDTSLDSLHTEESETFTE